MVKWLLIGAVLTFVGGQVWTSIAPRVWARRITRLVPIPGPQRRFAVWSRKGERLGTLWKHHTAFWLAYDGDERLVGWFGDWAEAAQHLFMLDMATRALRAEEAEEEEAEEEEAEEPGA